MKYRLQAQGAPIASRAVETGLLVALLFAAAVALQLLDGAYGNDVGGNGDEAGHFVTAVMVRDFLLGGGSLHPMAFAKSFYLHYPKVALGQWPPFLYALLGGWMMIFGASRAAALVFIAGVAAATATLIAAVGRPRAGLLPALLAALVFLASPLVQESTARVMTEHLVCLLSLTSALQFARYVRTARTADALGFGVLAALAILTKGSAWGLVLVPGGTMILTRRFDLLRRPALWLSALPVLILCVPWYWATTGSVTSTWASPAHGPPYWLSAIMFYVPAIWEAVGPAAGALALLGVFATVIQPWMRGGVEPVWAALAALMAAIIIMACAVPTGMDSRFMVGVLPEVVLFAATGLAWLAHRLQRVRPAPYALPGLCLVEATLFAAFTFAIPGPGLRLSGFAAAEQRLAARTGPAAAAILVISDEKGEGAAVAQGAEGSPSQDRFVLRGSKLLVREDWVGRGTEDKFPDPAALNTLLQDIPVSAVLLDSSIPARRREPYQDRVRALVTGDPQHWEPVGSMPVIRETTVFPDALQLYVRRQEAGAPRKAVDAALLARVIFANLDR